MEEVEELYRRTLAIGDGNHPLVAATLNTLVVSAFNTGKTKEAEE